MKVRELPVPVVRVPSVRFQPGVLYHHYRFAAPGFEPVTTVNFVHQHLL